MTLFGRELQRQVPQLTENSLVDLAWYENDLRLQRIRQQKDQRAAWQDRQARLAELEEDTAQ